MSSRYRKARPLWIVVALVATLLGATATGAATSSASTPQPSSSTSPASVLKTTLHYAINKPLCSQPAAPNAMRCFAYQRVDVGKGTPGAYAYVLPAASSRGPSGGLTPAALDKAYGVNPNLRRPKQLVAIVDWYDDPLARADLNSFDRHYGIPTETATSFRKVNQKGKTAPLPAPDGGSAVEIALDIETVRAVCHTCRILLVEANSPTENDLAAAENMAAKMGATVISNSWGEPEHPVSASVLAAFKHPGVVITASTGDDGWYSWDYRNTPGDHGDAVPSFPASDRYVVAVGGTTLTLAADGSRATETVWNANGPHDATGRSRQSPMGATGGGCSKLYAATPWQAHYPGYAAAGCKGRRLAADVAAVADPQSGLDVLDRYGSGGWVTVGGTSLSAPFTAAMYALGNGSAGAAYPSSAVYANAQSHPSQRYDVRSGGNGYCGSDSTTDCGNAVFALTPLFGNHNPNHLGHGVADCSFPRDTSDVTSPPLSSECNAVSGFDGPTGVGVPRGPDLFRRTDPTVTIGRAATAKVRKSVTFTARVRATAVGARVVTYLWSWGDGKSTRTSSATTHHTYAHSGKFAVTLSIVDTRYQSVRTLTSITITR
jgi:hypothetical protein